MKSVSQILLERTLFFMIACFIMAACSRTTKPDDNNGQSNLAEKHAESIAAKNSPPDTKSIERSRFLTLADAEKIMGEPMHVIDTATIIGAESLTYQCSYKANEVDPKTQVTGAIYFLLQSYNELSGAQERYAFIKKANEDHGIKELSDLGDEAYFHTDGSNFYFVMVRKGVNVFNIKVNKITSTTSLEAFNEVARQIAGAF